MQGKDFHLEEGGPATSQLVTPSQAPTLDEVHCARAKGVSSSSSFAAISSCQRCRKARGSWSVTQQMVPDRSFQLLWLLLQVKINQGQVFCLPSRIPHSPQRPEALCSGMFPLSPNVACHMCNAAAAVRDGVSSAIFMDRFSIPASLSLSPSLPVILLSLSLSLPPRHMHLADLANAHQLPAPSTNLVVIQLGVHVFFPCRRVPSAWSWKGDEKTRLHARVGSRARHPSAQF